MSSTPYQGLDFELADDPSQPLYLVFGVRKSGSSVLNSMIAAMAKHVDVNYVDVAGTLFKSGIPVGAWQTDAGIAQLMKPGNVLGGFRDFPFAFPRSDKWESARKLLLVRDPRDALVSEYFSNAYSHEVPAGGQSREVMLRLREEARQMHLEDFVLKRALSMVKTLSQYLPVRNTPNSLVLMYEELIPKKREHMVKIADHFGWNLSNEFIENVLKWADVQPTEEDPQRFIRKVTPGDHREKLSEETIAKLNETVGPIMRAYGYAVD